MGATRTSSGLGSSLSYGGHSARIIDAVLAGMIILRIVPGISIGLPPGQIALILLLAVAAFRRPTRSLRSVWWFPVVSLGVLGVLVLSGLLNDVDFVRRIVNVGSSLIFAGFLASGRIDPISVLKGMIAALVINTVLFYLGVAPDTYSGALSGFLGDKNVAGLYLVGVTLAALVFARTWPVRLLLIAGGAIGTALTGSRTAMAAFLASIVFLLLGRYLGMLFRLGFIGLLVYAFAWADENLAQIGVFATRTGSDDLRERIDAASLEKIQHAPFLGFGPSQGFVTIEDETWWFHNSYWNALAEGGWLLLILVIAIYTLTALTVPIVSAGRNDWQSSAIYAAVLGVMLAASRLGEVLLTAPAMLVIGVSLAVTIQRKERQHNATGTLEPWAAEQHPPVPAVGSAVQSR